MSDHIYMEVCQPTWMPCNHTLRVTKDLIGHVDGPACPYCRIAFLEGAIDAVLIHYDLDAADFADAMEDLKKIREKGK